MVIRALALLTGAAAIFTATAAQATIMVPLTLEQMAEKSAHIVRARVVSKMSAWDDSHKHIFTYTEIEVLEALRGASNAGHTMVLRTLGGEVGEVGMAVAGTAKFREGEEVVVFLRDDPVRAGDFQVIGMSQGKYRVKRTDGLVVLEPGLEGVAFARAGANGTLRVDPTTPGPGQVTLQELKRRVSAVAQPTKPAVKSPGSPTGQANPNTTPATPAAPVPQKTTR